MRQMRAKTRAVRVGAVTIGGGAPVSIQTMTTTKTRDIDATVAQVRALADAGADIVRVAVPTSRDGEALRHIVAASPVPIVADVHFNLDRAFEALQAGVAKIRINPGTLADRRAAERLLGACRERGVPVRIGVNEGSVVDRFDRAKRAEQRAALAADRRGGLVRLMVERLAEYVRICERLGFYDLVLSAKSPDAAVVIEVYRALARQFDYPLHLGLTHAGPPETGRIRSAAALGTLLAEGIGDTIRISYAADPLVEVRDAKELLCCLGLRQRDEPELIACPTCGRLEVDLLPLVEKVREHLRSIRRPITVAVMGCVVNGPGEAEGADVALCAGRTKAVICVRGRPVRTVRPEEMLDALLEEIRKFLA